MSRAMAYLLMGLMLAPLACAPRAGRKETTEDETKDRAKYVAKLQAYYSGIPQATQQMLPRIRAHVAALADLGPRQTGQQGCDDTLAYIRKSLAEAAPHCPATDLPDPPAVTVALDRTSSRQLPLVSDAGREFSHIVVDGLGPSAQRWPAYALAPNSVQACETHPPDKCMPSKTGKAPALCQHCELARRLVDLGDGAWEDFNGKDLDQAVVLLNFNSGDAWLRAAGLGAVGAVFIEPTQTTVFQADKKYLATLPLHFPRLYLEREKALALRGALAGGAKDLRVTLASRLEYKNVPARGLELTIPGKDRSYCFVLAGHFDARCIVPDLSYGSAELWGIAELIELTRHLAASKPPCDIRVIFTAGHWQNQRVMREYVAKGGPHYDHIGKYYKLAMGIDLVPQGRSLNLINEGMWDVQSRQMYRWLGNRLFNEGGWRDRIFDGLGLSREQVELYGGARPVLSRTLEGEMANRSDRSAMVFAPRYPTAEGAFQALGLPSFAFQTCRLSRLAHNTPLDRLGTIDAASADEQLAPQLKITLAVLRHLMDYPRKLLADQTPSGRRGRSWGGYAQIGGQVLQWDRSIGWFAERLPGTKQGRQIKTFVQAYSTDSRTTDLIGPRLRNYLHWPMNPMRQQHRELQAFMFQDLQLLQTPYFDLKTVYAWHPYVQYDVVGYSLDEMGRICWATDYGVHGDGDKAFQCTDLDLDGEYVSVPVSMFECGTLELFDLIDPQRYNPASYVYGSHYPRYLLDHADTGVPPHLRVTECKTADSHTDMEQWGFTQYGPTAMVFLPADHRVGAEVLLGSLFTNFAALNNPDAAGQPRGYTLGAAQTLRLTSGKEPTPLACVQQLAELNSSRLARFALHDVSSPLAKIYHQKRALPAVEAANAAQAKGDRHAAAAHSLRAWNFESQAYRETLKLLLDVVATTVLYFVLLIPFSFLIERLVLPQRTALRTVLVAAVVFVVFAAALYLFHPGFKLAHNVIVTLTAFVIVVMTIPALLLLLLRGTAMLRAIGSKSVITQRSEAETAGVVTASLSLAVSNMRRRRLRTALTLVTITIMVLALVLLTTSSAFDFQILEPAGSARAGFQGLQIYNAKDRRMGLLPELVDVYEANDVYEAILAELVGVDEAVLAKETLVVRREGIHYGYDPALKHNGTLFLTANGRQVALPYLQLMDHRDNLIEYTYRFYEQAKAEGEDKSVERAVKIHLSDLFKQRYEGAGQFAAPPVFGGRGEFLAPGDVDVVLLPNNMAEALGVDVGDTVTLMGLGLKVKGIFTATIEQTQEGKKVFLPGPIDRLADLDGKPITALAGAKFTQSEPDNPIHAPSREVAIVPRKWNRTYGIFPSVVQSLVVIPNDKRPETINALASRLATEILNVDVFSHTVDPRTGQSTAQRISMHTATHVKGSTMMLVVMGVAVLMILAIMTGTVYERMREIHIFSSVGLSPRHVAGMFLIEALVFAGIAAVLGYFLGIISLKALLWYLKYTGSAQEFYPNYLGVFVVYSIGIAVLATVASALYPIRLARKIITPSEGKWQLMEGADSGDLWHIRLPFIATTWNEARSMMVYAHDYLAIHQGERSGRFVCERPPAGSSREKNIDLHTPVWLAPFERNLSQNVELSARPAADADWWELWLDLRRNSGPPYLWRRGATVFVNMVCKHLLRWRAATAQQEADCLSRSEGIYPARPESTQ